MIKSFKNIPVCLATVLVIMLAVVFSFSLTTGITYATSETANYDSEITVSHMSDIHYFPYEYCFTETYRTNVKEYEKTDFFGCMTGDTKLVLESGITLAAHIRKYIEDAKAGCAPEYVVVSGDLCKNGERICLIDVANALRYLQNEVRKETGYENFQVFIAPGNHDLYNSSAEAYDTSNGKGYVTDTVTVKEFALIFAGLGYPDASFDGSVGINLSSIVNDENYWASSYTDGYIQSSNANNLTINYYNSSLDAASKAATSDKAIENILKMADLKTLAEKTGKEKAGTEFLNGSLSYSVKVNSTDYSFLMIDASERSVLEKADGAPIRISKTEFDLKFTDDKVFASRSFYLEDPSNSKKISSTKATKEEVLAAYAANKAVYIASNYDHITGGKVVVDVMDWMQKYCESVNTSSHEETVLTCFHMNVLPHWTQEDDILKDFTLYNWEYYAKRLLAMGIRYAYTGHQHASDVINYIDEKGRCLYDMETSSMIGYDSPRRDTTITRYDCDGALGETFESELVLLSSIKEIPDKLTSTATWDDSAYQTAFATYNASKTSANWNAVMQANPDFTNYTIKYEELSVLSYDEFINGDIFSRLLDRILGHYVSTDLITGLVGGLSGSLSSGGVSKVLGLLGLQAEDIPAILDYLVDTILYDLYPNFYPDGKVYENTIEYLKVFLDHFLSIEFGDASIQSSVNPTNKGKVTVKDIAAFVMLSHAGSIEVKLVDNTPAALQAEYAVIDSMFTEIPYDSSDLYSTSTEYRFKNPLDATYRKRLTAAFAELHEECINGDFAEFLFYALFKALYETNDEMNQSIKNNGIYKNLGADNYFDKLDTDKSILKAVLEYKFCLDTDHVHYSKESYDRIKKLCNSVSGILPTILKTLLGVDLGKEKINVTIDPDNLVLLDVCNSLMPVLQKLLAQLIGFGLTGDNLYDAVNNAVSGYITRSFEVGLGGIADNIVTAYAFDTYADLSIFTKGIEDFSSYKAAYLAGESKYQQEKYLYQPYAAYDVKGNTEYKTADANILKYGDTPMTYVSTKLSPSSITNEKNLATKDNGRLPSRLTSAFDNEDETGSYTIKFYTAEEVYAKFTLYDDAGKEILSTSTSYYTKDTTKDYIDSTASAKKSGITAKITTQTKPQYVPLIDLGLACLTHGEIQDEDDNFYTYNDRDAEVKNSVIMWNVTTVKISGLKADTKYFYDVAGVYEGWIGENKLSTPLTFSLCDATNKGNKFSMKTAKAAGKNETFSFLAIADIQGMIPSMYQDSVKALYALLDDESISNFDFFINAGDMCDNPKNFDQWSMACDTYQDLFANYPQFFTAGNHENGTFEMTEIFDYTIPTNKQGNPLISNVEGGIFYSFDYANLHITVLNTNDADANGLGKDQLAWLKSDLKSTKATWKIVLMHKSLYSGGSHSSDSEVVAMRKQLVPIFNQYGVSMVFAGHDHTYTTTVMLDKDGKESKIPAYEDGKMFAGAGTIYITLGTMGTKFYTYGENENVTPLFDDSKSIEETLSYQTFGYVTITGGELKYEAYKYQNGKISKVNEFNLTNVSDIVLDTLKAQAKSVSFDINDGEFDETQIFDASLVPAGYKVVYILDGERYTSLDEISFKGASASINVTLLNAQDEEVGTITTISLTNAKYPLKLGLGIGIPAGIVVIVVIIVVIVVVKKKKK